MTQQELWEQEYRDRRYLEFLEPSELNQRAKDIFLNQIELTDQGKIGFLPTRSHLRNWLRLWTHILQEYRLRGGGIPPDLAKAFPDPTSPLAKKAAVVVRSHNLKPGTFLAKYGEYRYMKDVYSKGLVRVSPATSYDDPSLNPALRDDELSMSVRVPSSEIKFEVWDRVTRKSKGPIEPIGDVTITKKMPTDYYVYCMSYEFAPRLFVDFKADACILIKSPREFLMRLLKAFVGPKIPFRGGADVVSYIDPLNSPSGELSVVLSKHFRHAYQKEFRAVWVPQGSIQKLNPVFVEMGSQEDICELVSLSEEE